MRREANNRPDSEAGFTLLEVLAAVAVAGFALSAIGAVVAVTFAGLRSTVDRVALTETVRALLDSLPQGDALKPGTTSGTMGTTRWRIDIAPLRRQGAGSRLLDGRPSAWSPTAIVILARTRSGRSLRLDTAGLTRDETP